MAWKGKQIIYRKCKKKLFEGYAINMIDCLQV